MATRWDDVLKQHGYRITPQRQFVLDAVNALRHASVEEILAEVQKVSKGVTLSTIYRALEVLEKVGLVTHAHIGHGAPTYHAVDHEEMHIHLVCDSCGHVESMSAQDAHEFVGHIESTMGFRADIGHMSIHGKCSSCQ